MKTQFIFKVLFLILVIVIMIPMLFPFFWMFITSLKTQVDIIHWPPKIFFSPTMRNFNRVF